MQITTPKRRIALLLLAAAILLSVFLPRKTAHLIIQSPRTGHIHYEIPIKPNDEFTLSYKHSVSLSMVHGTFSLTPDGTILPLTTVFTSYGPGLPWPAEENTKVEDGVITVYHNEPARESIRLWVSPLTGEVITLHGVEYDLAALSAETHLLEIRLKSP